MRLFLHHSQELNEEQLNYLIDQANEYFVYVKVTQSTLLFLTNLTAKGEQNKEIYLKISIFLMKTLNGYFYKPKLIYLVFKLMQNIIELPIINQTLINQKMMQMMTELIVSHSNVKTLDCDLLNAIMGVLCYCLGHPVHFELFSACFKEEQQEKVLQALIKYLKRKELRINCLNLLAITMNNDQEFENKVVHSEQFKKELKEIIENEESFNDKDLYEVLQFLPLEYLLLENIGD